MERTRSSYCVGGGVKIGGQVLQTLKYAGDLAQLPKEETLQQRMIDKPDEVGRCCGMEMTMENTTVLKISRKTF
jgi:hypothetical protein